MNLRNEPPRASIVMAPICSRCRAIIKESVYFEENFIGGNFLQKEEFYIRVVPQIHPQRCPKCGAKFHRIVEPKDVHIPYDVDYVLDKENKEDNNE